MLSINVKDDLLASRLDESISRAVNLKSDASQNGIKDLALFDFKFLNESDFELNREFINILLLKPDEFTAMDENSVDLFYDIILVNAASDLWIDKVKFLIENIYHIEPDSKILGKAVDSLPIGVFVKDAANDFQYSYWNKYLEESFGLPKASVIGKTDYDLFDKESADYHRKLELESFDRKEPVEIFTEELTVAGRITGYTIKHPVFDERGDQEAIIGILEDVSPLRKAEDRVKKYISNIETKNKNLEKKIGELEDKLAGLNEMLINNNKFFALIAHDLKNPFITFMGFIEILLSDYDSLSEDEKIYYLNEMDSTAKDAHKLLSNLLQWSRSQAGMLKPNPEKIVLRHIIEDVFDFVKPVADKKKIKLNSLITNGLSCFADYDMTHTVLRNLITNGIKFTNEEGMLTVSAAEKSDSVEITVEDTGVGMDDECAEKLFRFGAVKSKLGTNKERGTGLGLLITKEFIEKNGGEIRVESKLGIGTKIKFNLPTN